MKKFRVFYKKGRKGGVKSKQICTRDVEMELDCVEKYKIALEAGISVGSIGRIEIVEIDGVPTCG